MCGTVDDIVHLIKSKDYNIAKFFFLFTDLMILGYFGIPFTDLQFFCN